MNWLNFLDWFRPPPKPTPVPVRPKPARLADSGGVERRTSPLSRIEDDDLWDLPIEDLAEEIRLFRKALRYCRSQQGDDHCWMDYRHLLMRFLPGYDPATDDVTLDADQLENCKSFIRCWQERKDWDCLGGDKGKTVPARSIGTLDCLP